MKRSLALTVPFALAACFSLSAFAGLTGCTIYTYEAPPPRHSKPKPAATKPGGLTLNKTAPKSSTGKTSFNDVPTVTSSTVFGGSSVAAFHGLAYVIPEGTSRMPNFNDLVPFGQLYID